jgi:two-component system phosphate regulon sensor histidine kinase PhoR
MNIVKIRWIIGLMSMAMLGLIYFQTYWISSVIDANEARFDQDVREVLSIVTEKLEKREVASIAMENLNSKFQWQRPMSNQQMEFYETTFEKRIINRTDSQLNVGRFKNFSYSFDSHYNKEEDKNRIFIDKKLDAGDMAILYNSPKRNIRIQSPMDGIDSIEQRLQRNLERMMRKSEMVHIVIQELLSTNKNIMARVTEKELDSMLAAEFRVKGITIPYNFGILQPRRDKFLLEVYKDSTEATQLKESKLRAGLFPNDIMGDSEVLMVSFPDQASFLLRKIGITLSSSALLILVILFCFGYAIHTILLQKKLSDIKNDFINNMTHEFKTPIATVALACEALQDNDVNVSPSLLKRYVKIIGDENNRLGQQVEKVLQMAVIERQDFKLKLGKVNLETLIGKVLDNEHIQIEKRGGTISTQLKALKHEIEADQLHITNIIHNLLDNANKYSYEKPDITVSTMSTSHGITLSVSDKGIGMSPDQVRKIFDRFYRIPTGNLHDVKGFGLGLAYVKRIVELHGGDIAVKSELQSGTTFSLFFPFQHEQN